MNMGRSVFRCLGIAALSFCGFLLISCEEEKPPAVRPVAEVSVLKIEPRDVPVTFEYIAQTQSSHQVEIRARVNGFLDKRVYTEGDIVKEGQVLFLMDKKPFQAQLDASAAALDRQKAAMETARLNLKRVRPLAAEKAVSQKDLDDATGLFDSSAAAVEQAKAQLETAKLNLSYCTIVSPVAGITGAALQQDGAYLSALNSQLTTVAVLSPMWVEFSLSENEMRRYHNEVAAGKLRAPKDKNYEVQVILVDGSIFPHTGRITFTAPSYSAQTGTFLMRASLENPQGVLRPNQYVRVRLVGAVRPKAVVVPQRAVQQGAKGHFLWLVNKESKADFRPVVIGDWLGNDIFISQGLQAGDQVVVDGGLTLQPDAPVKIKAPATEPAAAQTGQTTQHGTPKTDH